MKKFVSEPKQLCIWPDVIVMSDEIRFGGLLVCPWCNSWQQSFTVPTFALEALADASFCVNCHGLVEKPCRFNGPVTKTVPISITLKNGKSVAGRGDYCDFEPESIVHTECCQSQQTEMVQYHLAYSKKADVTETGWECPVCMNEVFLKFRGRAEVVPDAERTK